MPSTREAVRYRNLEHPEREIAWDHARYLRKADKLRALKAGACTDCGLRYPPYVMDFDHRPGEEKLFTIGTGVTRSDAAILAEIAKCDLVCANCHRVRTYQRLHPESAPLNPS